MPVTGFNHFNLRAPRALLDALRDFYVDVVGLRPGPRPPFDSFGYWLYIGEKDILHLTETGPHEQRVAHAGGTFDHVAFTCAGREQFESHLRRLGIRYERADVPGSRQTQLFFADPAGNGIELNFSEEDGN